MCPQVICADPSTFRKENTETSVLAIIYQLPIACDDSELPVIKSNIEADIRNNDPLWPGTIDIDFKCVDGQKRATSTLQTEATLSGPGAASQANALSHNLEDSTVNGIFVDFVSANAAPGSPAVDGSQSSIVRDPNGDPTITPAIPSSLLMTIISATAKSAVSLLPPSEQRC